MDKIKDFFVSTFGIFGFILWYIVAVLLAAAPLFCVFDFPFLLNCLIIAFICVFPVLGFYAELLMWFSSLYFAFHTPLDVVLIIYYIAFAFYIFTRFIPWILSVFSSNDR